VSAAVPTPGGLTEAEREALRVRLVNARWEATLRTPIVAPMNAREKSVLRSEVKAEAAWYAGAIADVVAGLLRDRLPEATTVTEWGVRRGEGVEWFGIKPGGAAGVFTEDEARYISTRSKRVLVRRTATRYADQYGPWEEVE